MTGRRSLVAAIGLAAVLGAGLGAPAALGADGDLVFSRLSGRDVSDGWADIAIHGPAVYTVGYGDHAVLRRYDRKGGVVWTRPINVPGAAHTRLYQLAVDNTGIYVAGSFGDVHDSRLAFVARYRTDSSLVWRVTVPSAGDSEATVIDSHGDYIYVGGAYSDHTGLGLVSSFVRKLTRDGIDVWTRRIPGGEDAYLQNVQLSGIAASEDGVYLAGAGYVDDGTPGYMSFVRLYDQEGDHPRTDTRVTGDESSAVAITADRDAAYVLVQARDVDAFPYGSFLFKYDDSASFVWQRRITARSTTLANGVTLSADAVWITGVTRQRLTNQAGTSADPDGDAFLVRYSRSGSPQLTYQYAAPRVQSGHALAVDETGVYVAGVAADAKGVQGWPSRDGLLMRAELP